MKRANPKNVIIVWIQARSEAKPDAPRHLSVVPEGDPEGTAA
jgi:hypothetical protein